MQTQTQDYVVDGKTFEAFIAYDDTLPGKRPAVLVAHDWTGRNEFACDKAKSLAELGYVGIAIDMYGKGVLGQNNEEKSAHMTPMMEDRGLLRQRLLTAYETIMPIDVVDKDNVAIMGFCFGGLCALDLARTGVNLKGTLSFHGFFHGSDNLASKQIQGKIIAFHGHKDPMVPAEQLTMLADEMTTANVDWQLHVFGNAMHAFTNPLANDPDFGTLYDADADNRSWLMTVDFLEEIFTV